MGTDSKTTRDYRRRSSRILNGKCVAGTAMTFVAIGTFGLVAPAQAANELGPAVESVSVAAGLSTVAEAPSSQIATQARGEGQSTDASFLNLRFAHPVSLLDATSVLNVGQFPILGYRLESESMVGDYWPGSGLSEADFLAEIDRETGTAPEVVGAYIDANVVNSQKRSEPTLLPEQIGEELPEFDAPPPDPEKMKGAVRSTALAERPVTPPVARMANETWQPTRAQADVMTFTSNNLAITAKYDWSGTSPYASPLIMADHWGMEFQFDFYTTLRPNNPLYPIGIGYGLRPNCGATTTLYKDWAAASTRVFDWFGWVANDGNIVSAPGSLGLYGDYNDATDPCEVSTIAVGMAAPGSMPYDLAGNNHLSLYMYPLRGEDTQSRLGAIVQPVSRTHCELNPSMPLTDCMGVTPGQYPGPGPHWSRMVLNEANGHMAPDLCWYAPDYDDPAEFWDCYW